MLQKLFKIKRITATLAALFNERNAKLAAISAAAVLMTACASNGGSTVSQSKTPKISQRAHSSDIWERVRNGYQMPDLYNSEVTKKEDYYAQRADYMGRMATRSGDFMYLIMNEVERRNMPSVIALLPFVESAFVTTAKSPVKAAGLWQFMPATGKDFALQQNHYADQRNDVVASTDAALTYLQRLHDLFGDWQLALAAYNWGQGNVGKAVRSNIASGGSGTYSEIRMPLETRQYVPKLQAIKNIVNNPAQYGITLPKIENSLRNEAVTVTRDIDISTAASIVGMSIDEFTTINPAYKKSIIVASLGSKILVPANRADNLRNAFKDRSRQLASLTTYSTYNTEALNDIASRYNTSTDNLRSLNNIPYDHDYVKAGSAILVPRNNRSDDIPYQALTAGLSTTSSGFGLATDYVEQENITIASNDTVDRYEHDNIVKDNNSGLSYTALNVPKSSSENLGALINNSPRLNDPVRTTTTTVASTATTSVNQNSYIAPITPSSLSPDAFKTLASTAQTDTPVVASASTNVVAPVIEKIAEPVKVAEPIVAIAATSTAAPIVEKVAEPILDTITASASEPTIAPEVAQAIPAAAYTPETAVTTAFSNPPVADSGTIAPAKAAQVKAANTATASVAKVNYSPKPASKPSKPVAPLAKKPAIKQTTATNKKTSTALVKPTAKTSKAATTKPSIKAPTKPSNNKASSSKTTSKITVKGNTAKTSTTTTDKTKSKTKIILPLKKGAKK